MAGGISMQISKQKFELSIDFLKFNNKQNLDHNTFFGYLDVHTYMDVLCKSRTS